MISDQASKLLYRGYPSARGDSVRYASGKNYDTPVSHILPNDSLERLRRELKEKLKKKKILKAMHLSNFYIHNGIRGYFPM